MSIHVYSHASRKYRLMVCMRDFFAKQVGMDLREGCVCGMSAGEAWILRHRIMSCGFCSNNIYLDAAEV